MVADKIKIRFKNSVYTSNLMSILWDCSVEVFLFLIVGLAVSLLASALARVYLYCFSFSVSSDELGMIPIVDSPVTKTNNCSVYF